MAGSAMSQRTLQGVHRFADFANAFIHRNSALPADSGALLDTIEGVNAFIRLRDYLRDNLKLAFDEAFGGLIEDYNGTGQLCRAAFTAALMAFEGLRREVEDANVDSASEEVRRHFEQAVQDFRKAETEIRTLQGQFETNWPWVDTTLLARSLAGEGAQDRRPAKVAFDEIRTRHRQKSH